MPQPPSFHVNGLTISLHPDVYEPAEDTYQLLDAITIYPHDTILELGTGCGLIALYCAQQGCNVICTDLNPFAVQMTRENIAQNKHLLKGTIEVRQGDLFLPIKKGERFKIIVFNLPYLPTKPHERVGGSGWLDLATDGRENGLKITRKFLRQLPHYLQKNGHAYFIYSSRADRTILTKQITAKNAQAEIISTQRFMDESLDVYRISFP